MDAEQRKLYNRWRKYKDFMTPEWKDFKVFSAWAIENGWTPRHSIRWAKGPNGLCGPDSTEFYINNPPVSPPPEPLLDAKPGYENRPCRDCKQREYCAMPCKMFLAWWDVTMAAYRRALGVRL